MWDEISLDKIIKSINSQTNNTSSGNDGYTAEFYKHSSNELAPVLLDVYDYWGKLVTIAVISRTWIISVICKKTIKTILQTTDPYTTILKNQLQKTLYIIISENHSAAIKKNEQF